MAEPKSIESLVVPTVKVAQVYAKPKPTDSAITIVNHEGRTLVTIRWNGAIEYDPADLDEAARLFWDAIGNFALRRREPR